MPVPSAPPSHRWQGPLRAAAAVFIAGFLVVWLVKPIGDPCPELDRLPQGSTASSSPSFAPPGARTCTYTAAGGTQARATRVPWLDWIVLVLLAALVAGAVRAASPAGRGPQQERAPRPPRVPRPRRAPRPARAKGVRGVSSAHDEKPHTPPGAVDRPARGRGAAARAKPAPERDAAERERARRERAERDRARRTP